MVVMASFCAFRVKRRDKSSESFEVGSTAGLARAAAFGVVSVRLYDAEDLWFCKA